MARFATLAEWLHWQEQCHPRPIDLGLDRVASVYRGLGGDAGSVPTITVAGTNGKGSCIAYLEAIYLAQGYRVGVYTSPHILEYNERIRIDGKPLDDDAICDSFARIDQVRGDTSLSYFEFGTLAALDLFRREQVDVQLLEVGLGGRLDAVNIIDPDVAVVTTIAMDHVEWLGDNLDAIGREKAGIFRPHKPAVIGDYQPPQGLLDAAQESACQLFLLGQDFDIRHATNGWYWLDAEGEEVLLLPDPALSGEHQYRNAASVVTAALCLRQRLPVSDEALRSGLKSVKLLGRFQKIQGERQVLLDVGHNPQAIETLKAHLHRHYPGVTVHALFNMMKDKDIKSVLGLMRDEVAQWYIAPLKTQRAVDESELLNYFQMQAITSVHAGFDTFSTALATARQAMAEGDLLVVFGSFFLISEFLAASRRGE
jgi:dihydrofolate synthase / folylpolyglutamate synthase